MSILNEGGRISKAIAERETTTFDNENKQQNLQTKFHATPVDARAAALRRQRSEGELRVVNKT